MKARFLLLICLALGALGAGRLAAQANAVDPWLMQLTLLLDDHFTPDGRLELDWGRENRAEHNATDVLELVTTPQSLASQMVARVQITREDGSQNTYSLILAAKLWTSGWSLREPALMRTPVVGSALVVTPYDALRLRDVLQWDESTELDFARNLPGGRLLTWRDVVRRPLVRRNQAVEVTATDGALTVTLRGIALHDAVRGEAVRVRNPDTRKEFVATVSDDARAFVNF